MAPVFHRLLKNQYQLKLPLIILTGHRKSGTSLFHRLFDGLDGINLYPTDLSMLYAYFPCFTGRKDITDAELRARLLHVLDQSISYICKQNSSVVKNKKKLLNLLLSRVLGVFSKRYILPKEHISGLCFKNGKN